jgi:hypothetical protein
MSASADLADARFPLPYPVRVHPAPAPLSAPLRSGLVYLALPARPCGEVHEDVARIGWPPGEWCE